jgi:hypothetical protein
MKTWIHAEWDDTQLSVLLVQGRGKRAKVTAKRVTCTAAAEALGKTLAEACGEAMKGKVELVLAVNDRRFVCGSAAPGGKDLAATVFEDARKNGLMGQPDECLVGYVPRGKALGYCVAPRSLVEELDRGLVAAGFQRRRITAGEVVTANLSQDEEAIGVLDLREGRGTFTLAANGLPLASRRLRLPGNAGSRPWEDPDLTLLLTTELQRSLQFFKQQGRPAPARVFVTGNVEGSSAMVITAMTTMLSTAVAYPERAAVERVVDAGLPLTWVVPALASVLEPRSLPSVVEPRYLSRVEKTVITVSQTLAAACLGVGAWIGWQACQPSVDELRRTLASKTTELTAARVEVDRLRTEKAVPELVMQRRRVLAQRADDRSVSLLLAGVAAAMPPGAKLTQLELEPDQKLTIEGLFAANASPGPVESFAAFDRRLRGLPGVRSSGGNVDPPGEHGLARFESWVSPKEKP